MKLLSKKNIAKAKELAEKNKEKIAAGVNKATDAIDKKTGGKHTDTLKKVDDAAQKFAAPDADGTGQAAADAGTDVRADDAGDTGDVGDPDAT